MPGNRAKPASLTTAPTVKSLETTTFELITKTATSRKTSRTPPSAPGITWEKRSCPTTAYSCAVATSPHQIHICRRWSLTATKRSTISNSKWVRWKNTSAGLESASTSAKCRQSTVNCAMVNHAAHLPMPSRLASTSSSSTRRQRTS